MKECVFDEVVPRRNSGSYKWDAIPDDVLPLWVADMDFKAAEPIRRALGRRVEHGVFGYTNVPDAYYDSVIRWFGNRHSWQIKREEIIYTTGVVPAISAIVQAMTRPGDKVVLQTPVYNCFFSSVRNSGCQVVRNELIYHEGTYSIDFDHLRRITSDDSVRLMILCNPHNPSGRVWTREELQRIADICISNHVFIISDEIHCEICMPGIEYTPLASLSEEVRQNCAVCTSPSKSFNIAGLQIANITIADQRVRRCVDRIINRNEVCDVNPFGVDALIAAYNECGWWVDSLCSYIWANYEYFASELARICPSLSVCRLEGTYLAWVDCIGARRDASSICRDIEYKAKVKFNAGLMYGDTDDRFFRVNLACPRSILEEALGRISSACIDL